MGALTCRDIENSENVNRRRELIHNSYKPKQQQDQRINRYKMEGLWLKCSKQMQHVFPPSLPFYRYVEDNKGLLHLSILSFMLLSYIFSTANLCWFLQLINITIYCTGLMHEVCTCVCVCARVCAFSIKGCLRLKLGWVPTSVSVHRQYAWCDSLSM